MLERKSPLLLQSYFVRDPLSMHKLLAKMLAISKRGSLSPSGNSKEENKRRVLFWRARVQTWPIE